MQTDPETWIMHPVWHKVPMLLTRLVRALEETERSIVAGITD